MKKLYLIAGERSGDTHGAGVLVELNRRFPGGLNVAGAGGPLLRGQTGERMHDWVERAGVVGLWEVVKHYGYFKERFAVMLQEVRAFQPDAVLFIDYPGFNLRFAKALRAEFSDLKLIYYISPQVWAWKRGRIKVMARLLDLVICLFPFEPAIYERSGLRAVFAGHPMVDALQTWRGVSREPNLAGLFPGSRKPEVRVLFPILLKTAERVAARLPHLRFAVPAASEELAGEMREMLRLYPQLASKVDIQTGTAHRLMATCAAGLVASGTATLEAACLGLPYALIYKVNRLTYEVGKRLIKVPFLGMLNILAGKQVVKEFVQEDCKPERLANELYALLRDAGCREALQAELQKTVGLLGQSGAYATAADYIAREMIDG